ncbi:hypothetical protein ACWC1D_00275 [Streptomyces sp. NPDC001478]
MPPTSKSGFTLKKTIASELGQLRTGVPATIRILNQLALEIPQLREEITTPEGHVIALPSPRRPS